LELSPVSGPSDVLWIRIFGSLGFAAGFLPGVSTAGFGSGAATVFWVDSVMLP
jgi:hypothetical protein